MCGLWKVAGETRGLWTLSLLIILVVGGGSLNVSEGDWYAFANGSTTAGVTIDSGHGGGGVGRGVVNRGTWSHKRVGKTAAVSDRWLCSRGYGVLWHATWR